MELCHDSEYYDKWSVNYHISWGGDMEQLREKLKELRKRRRWSQEDLAREVCVSLSTIQRWERRDASRPFRLAQRELRRLFEESGIDVGED